MPETYEKDGIVYFKEPYEVDYSDWIFQHLDCDSIVVNESLCSNKIKVICYAKKEIYNNYLRSIRKSQYPNEKILRGVGAEEVNCID